MMKIIFHEEWEISHNEHGNQTDNLVKSYKTNLNNINDLKHDVKKKILEPLVERALQSVSNSVSHAIREKAVEVLNTKLWAMALPNEQRSASHYWHAPNARMAQKYNVLIGKEKVEWGALMPQAVTDLPHGFSVHCLNSEALLLEETLEMDHCVWSYVDKCIGNNYHIFSIRDKDGKHATTLTLHAIPYAEGEEPFKIFHHLGYKNRHAAGSEQEAAQELLRRLNKGEIKPDWDKMERQRKQAREAWEAKKMDPMDDAMFQRVLDLYKPCLPKALRKCEFTADGLIKTLGIHNIFEEVLQQDRSVARKMSTYISTQPHQAAGPL